MWRDSTSEEGAVTQDPFDGGTRWVPPFSQPSPVVEWASSHSTDGNSEFLPAAPDAKDPQSQLLNSINSTILSLCGPVTQPGQ